MKNNHNINWKLYETSITTSDGIVLKSRIHYWAKDFNIRMTYPLSLKGCGSHLQYGIPAVYSTTETPLKGVVHINLIERAQNISLSLYTKHKSELNALDVKRLIADGYFHNDKALFENCCRAWNVSAIDRIILEEMI